MTTDISIINEQPLEHFDALYQNKVAGLSNNQRRDETILCLLAIAGHPSEDKKNLVEQLTSVLDPRGVEQKDVLGPCLLLTVHDLDTDRWIIDNPKLRGKVMTLLDELLSGGIYQEIRIDKSKQTHEKLPDVTTAVSRFEEQLRGAVAELTSLERINSHRQSILKILRSKFGQFILKPFLSPACTQELNEVYTRVDKYVQVRDTLDVLDSYEDAVVVLSKLERSLDEYNTHYSIILTEVVTKLHQLLKDDFESNAAAQPAEIVIERNTKKYPLDRVGQQTDLVFSVRNIGSGYAYDVRLEILSDKYIEPLNHLPLKRIAPQAYQVVHVPTTVLEYASKVAVMIIVYWRNYGFDEEQSHEFTFDVESQQIDIDWATLEQLEPYSLGPVMNKHDLVGRTSDINRLIGLVQSSEKTGSAYITGQKRVGKTSIAKALHSYLKENNYITIYLEGDYIQSTPQGTVQDLGKRLCRLIRREEPAIQHLDLPSFQDDLSPLRDFLDDVVDITDRRIVFILDEFDEIPPGLYSPNDMANAFFMALRNTSSRPSIGFVLVGGEKMEHIFQSQGMHLNKWHPIAVDYFEFNSDYRDLIKRPVDGMIEYSEEALNEIYETTAGNPYFTKLLCGYIYSEAVQNRDIYVTEIEARQAINVAVNQVGFNTFQHFWDDGIDRRSENEDEKRERRRRLLIAICDVLGPTGFASLEDVIKHPLLVNYGRTLVEGELSEFVRRKVLVSDAPGIYRFKVSLFHEWLVARGTQEVLASFTREDIAIRERIQDEGIRVRPEEITQVISSWDTKYYKGTQITTDAIRTWLSQFGTVREQRAMFSIIKGLKFFSDGFVRQKLRDAHKTRVEPGLVRQIEARQRKRDDILVSYFVGVGKSGASFARTYATECEIKLENVVERNRLVRVLQNRSGINALVIADDFVGTGSQISGELKRLDRDIGGIIREKNIRVVLIVTAALLEGQKQLEEVLDQLEMPIELYVGQILSEEDTCFSPNSRMFTSDEEREFARQVAERYGETLSREYPLGYGNQGVAVVFEDSCPNNSLPILWWETMNGDSVNQWHPLFKR